MTPKQPPRRTRPPEPAPEAAPLAAPQAVPEPAPRAATYPPPHPGAPGGAAPTPEEEAADPYDDLWDPDMDTRPERIKKTKARLRSDPKSRGRPAPKGRRREEP
jgi:hypothetical protein